jgi:O-antigen/teichoic acid export membrane protein
MNILAARAMGPVGRGQIAQFLQIGYVVAVVALAGVDRAYPVLAADPPLAVAIRHTIRLVTPGVAVVAGCCLLMWPVLAMGGSPLSGSVAALALLVAGSAGMAALRAAATAAGVGGPFRRTSVVGQIGLVATGGVLVFFRVDAATWWLLAYGTWLLLPVLYWRQRAASVNLAVEPVLLNRIHQLGWRLLPPTLATMVMLRSDRLLLPVLGSYQQMGVYIVVATVTEVAVWPVQAFLDAHGPRWARQWPTRRTQSLIFAVVVGVLMVAGTGLVAACQVLVVPVFGDAYAAAAGLAVPLAIGAVLFGIGRVGAMLLVAAHATRRVLVAEMGAAAVAVVVYLWLIPTRGAWGAAVGSAVAYGVYALLSGVLALTCRRGTSQLGPSETSR